MTSPQPGLATLARNETKSPWIESRGFDLACFILSPLAGLALLLAFPIGGPTLAILAAALVGGPHYAASFTFFFWKDSAPHHRERWIVHFLVPTVIVLLVAAVALLRVPFVVMFVIYFWNAYHVARQSCGILSVYRLRGGYSDDRHKRIVNAAIISVSFCMLFWNIEWYVPMHGLLSGPSAAFPRLLWLGSLAAAVVSMLLLAASLAARYRQGKGPSAPEWAFLATSLTLFHPYLWVRDADLATLGMLMGHFIQYLAIVWLVNRRKFASRNAPEGRYGFAMLWQNKRLLAGVYVFTAGFFLVLQLTQTALGVALVLLHFYLDGIFWAFRRAEVRRALGPYLTGWKPEHHPATLVAPDGARAAS